MRSSLGVAAWATLAFAVTLAIGAPDARANEPDAYGLGSRASAMASAAGADATDFSANYYNPAGLASAEGIELTVGYTHAWNRLRINGLDTGVPNVHGLVGGLVAPGKVFGIPFAFGIATHLPDDGLSRVSALRQEVPRWELYQNRLSILFLAANLAVRPVRWLEIGGGVAFLASTRGRFAISGTADVANPYASQLRHEVDADLTSIRYLQAGLRVLLGSLGAIGLTYRGQTKLKLSLDARLEGSILAAGLTIPILYTLDTSTIDAFTPQQLVLGFSFQKIEHLHVNFDLAFVNWAAYESPTAETRAHLAAKLPPGITSVTLPADPKLTVIIPPAFENRFVPRLGVEYLAPVAGPMRRLPGREKEVRAFEVPLRAGVAYERSPVPPQRGFTNFVDADRVTLTVGTGAALNAPSALIPGSLRLDVHAELSILPERVNTKDNAVDFVGDYRSGGTMVNIGATLGAVF
jgi:long-chain fatty acid transport protein